MASLRNLSFRFNGIFIEEVLIYKYLGIILSCNLCEKEDKTITMHSFNRNSVMLFRKFSNVDNNVKMKLLSALCMSFYVSELWSDKLGSLNCFKQFVVAYHYALKKILGLPKSYNNHIVCRDLEVF